MGEVFTKSSIQRLYSSFPALTHLAYGENTNWYNRNRTKAVEHTITVIFIGLLFIFKKLCFLF